MFILMRSIKRPGNEPFVPLPPPSNPQTGKNLTGVPFEQALVRPKIRKGEKEWIMQSLRNI